MRTRTWLSTCRFIPARAGNTYLSQRSNCCAAVHPRACGEHNVAGFHAWRNDGSSPRVRGTLPVTRPTRAKLRFIPARAGNTLKEVPCVRYQPVHPRACGEHMTSLGSNITTIGSSPRVRGTHHAEQVKSLLDRFIPARAGNTTIRIVRGRFHAVHPRACGEHMFPDEETARLYGSSPRVRGTHRGGPAEWMLFRFIPARAGNTVPFDLISLISPVHPRACGEHSKLSGQTVPAVGSSPRVRGTLLRLLPWLPGRRFIPARAGNTGY